MPHAINTRVVCLYRACMIYICIYAYIYICMSINVNKTTLGDVFVASKPATGVKKEKACLVQWRHGAESGMHRHDKQQARKQEERECDKSSEYLVHVPRSQNPEE